jgi:hypothetical protein
MPTDEQSALKLIGRMWRKIFRWPSNIERRARIKALWFAWRAYNEGNFGMKVQDEITRLEKECLNDEP